MAFFIASGSRISPLTTSHAIPSTFVRGLLARRTTRIFSPRVDRARATAEPTKPEAAVTSAISDILGLRELFVGSGKGALAFHRLPRKKNGDSDGEFARAFEQRRSETHFLRQSEHRREPRISG